jgi:hypothetical protein
MGILDQLRTTTVADLEGVRSDFDDLPRGHFSAAKVTGMTRIVEGADDLAYTGPRNSNPGMIKTRIPNMREGQCLECGGVHAGGASCAPSGHLGDTCDNPRCCPDATPEPMRDRQAGKIWYLTTKVLRPINPSAADAADAWFARNKDTMTKVQASEWIDRLKAKIDQGPDNTPVAQAPVVAEAPKANAWARWRELAAKLAAVGGHQGTRFAVDTNAGAVNTLAFWRISPSRDGSRFYLNQVIGGQGPVKVRMSPEAMVAIAEKIIAAGPVEAMIRYGLELGSCGHCGRPLTNDVSRAAGIGPVCVKKMGGWN